MKNGGIKNLLFDLGGVILDLDKQKCFDSFTELGVDLNGHGLGFYGQKGLLGELELGLIDEADFYERFREEYGTNADNASIKRAWNSFLIGIPAGRLEFLKILKQNYNMFLLSNTSKIHHDYWHPMFSYDSQRQGANYFFDGIYCSYMSQVAKPDRKAFENVITRTGIVPEETLFFDDSEANVKAASEMGFKTVLIPEGEKLEVIYIDKLV
ncbi:HAD family hydrolase [Saccharicrinis sp. FJH54]|uniref:HAD family hydrolase n=1 Tax=Saccharicrinis sp. FJH54 TaxID=3344665 RepID=UPI0035D3E532